MTKKIYLFLIFVFLTPLTGCYTTNQNEISNYERFGSNTYTIWNVPEKFLTTDDSQCVTKLSSVSVNNYVTEQVTRNCIEVMKLGNEASPVSDMFFEILNSFFNSPSGMMLFSELLSLL